MRLLIPIATLLLAAPALFAQIRKPYSEGNVDAFLQQARAKSRPAIVLFNFNRESG